ncbi:hypothetical protein M406DRAFT_291465 [Cryphonectria parasitica EP155]|uniref:Calcineurin-like phosphoesterase domain-containing protein n=1 Tax=Cryphonectria parasitica (strain ATCC 38755 / EP155) TaxID=660469 RepID=A0A9P4Y0Z3_CRYP1|nr:uncharacterized protein M406DRAFT_291465 [Cryphonectria parasitica EP155]KAF3764395.1 hypothetical protein M406DRAFT_291465 [Cryphonectria parasitica EP155]
MASYPSGSSSNGASSSSLFTHSKLRQSHANIGDDSSLLDDCFAGVQKSWQSLLVFWSTRGKRGSWDCLLQGAHQLRSNLATRRLFSFPHVLVAIWLLVLMWGERWVFHTTVERCAWENWEEWPPGATPHHLIFVADPQLIDPHSYPGRPWPISSLTVAITDNYMRRSYTQLQSQLHPDTVFFLGDLFDGGREWKTFQGEFEDPSWNHRPKGEVDYAKQWNQKYGEEFWLKEYIRFIKLFVDPWNLAGSEAGPGQRGRRLIASLPGNHDLGFGSEVKIPVRDRFEAFFGDMNRVDVIANHTFVSVDTVSLSARTSAEKSIADLSDIYKPAQEFLDKVQVTKRKAVERELRRLRGETTELQQRQDVQDVQTPQDQSADVSTIPTLDPGEGKAELPTILLSHVPLYRPPGTPCGPMREHWPPANPPLDVDHRNAISVSGGYQYQNVLSDADSADLVKKIGGVVHAFSGDDHDYCELTHDEAKGHVKEITVKSISMAMGVPTPGFVMMSMYNPVDSQGKPLSGDQSRTLQTHLCLLPNQLSTYARYGGFAFVCFVMLTIRAFLVPILLLEPFALEPEKRRSVLPMFKAKREDQDTSSSGYGYGLSASHYHSSSPYRSGTRDRSARWGWGEGPKIEIDLGEDDEYYYDGGKSRWKASASRRGGIGSRSSLRVVGRELWTTAWRVLWMVGCYWVYLTWKG